MTKYRRNTSIYLTRVTFKKNYNKQPVGVLTEGQWFIVYGKAHQGELGLKLDGDKVFFPASGTIHEVSPSTRCLEVHPNITVGDL